MTVSPPGPLFQKINTLVQKEPVATVVHCIYWCFFLTFWVPIAIVYLQVAAAVKLFWYFNGGKYANTPVVDPRNKKEELAVVITGCDTGFGKELALWTAEAGFVVFAGCLQESSLKQFQGVFPNLIPFQLDVTSDKDVANAVKLVKDWLAEGNNTDNNNDKVKDTTSSTSEASTDDDKTPLISVTTTTTAAKPKKRFLHALINNAGILRGGTIDWISLDTLQQCLDVNFMGTARCCKAFLPLFKEQVIAGTYPDHGRVLNMTSMAGLITGTTGMSAYHASKFATQAYTSCLRSEMADFNIQVASINPTYHATPMVLSMNDVCTKLWNDMPAETKAEYGEEYFEHFRFNAVDVPAMCTWKVENVVDQIVENLKTRWVPPEILVGIDARFLYPIIRMVPAWVLDVNRRLQRRPKPAVLRK